MALVTIYFNPDATGANDGSSEADGYTDLGLSTATAGSLLERLTTEIVTNGNSVVIRAKNPSTPYLINEEHVTFAGLGVTSATQHVTWIGYDTTINDGGIFKFQIDGNTPEFKAEIDGWKWVGLEIEDIGPVTNSAVIRLGEANQYNSFFRVKIKAHNGFRVIGESVLCGFEGLSTYRTNEVLRVASGNLTPGSMHRCIVKSNSPDCVRLIHSDMYDIAFVAEDCLFIGAGTSATCVTDGLYFDRANDCKYISVTRCRFFNLKRGIAFDEMLNDTATKRGCLIADNVFSTIFDRCVYRNAAGTNGTTTNTVKMIRNRYWNVTTEFANFGDYDHTAHDNIALTADPFDDAANDDLTMSGSETIAHGLPIQMPIDRATLNPIATISGGGSSSRKPRVQYLGGGISNAS